MTSNRRGGGSGVRSLLNRWDQGVFEQVAKRQWPAAEAVLPRLSRGADHGLLWLAAAAGMTAAGGRPARRAAVRGLASLAVASLTVNTLGKRTVRRQRPLLDVVPVVRQLSRQPFTTSFPSGHAASAAAFAVGAGLESRRWGAALAPVAWSVAFSRVYTGVHHPGDVLAGMALGAGAAFAVRGVAPTRDQLGPQARPRADAPALARGRGLVVVANSTAGTGAEALSRAQVALPEAEFVVCEPDGKPLAEQFEAAAARARALGVLGGDGTVNAAVAVALRHRLPLAVLPGGTLNHFAADLGIDTVEDTARAVTGGDAAAVDIGRFRPGPDGAPGYFANTLSLGAYPDLVRVREEWAPRIGGPAAGVLAVFHVLRTGQPFEAELNGRRRRLWLLFAGNCGYRGLGLAPVRRHDLADGQLDVRIVHAGRWARTRLLTAALTGSLRRSPVHSAVLLPRLRIDGLTPGAQLAHDGEVVAAPRESLYLDKADDALTVYRPLPVTPADRHLD